MKGRKWDLYSSAAKPGGFNITSMENGTGKVVSQPVKWLPKPSFPWRKENWKGWTKPKQGETTVKESDKYMWAGGALSIVGVVFVVPENIIIGIITVGVGLFLLTTGFKKR
jgi:hypothetical protein